MSADPAWRSTTASMLAALFRGSWGSAGAWGARGATGGKGCGDARVAREVKTGDARWSSRLASQMDRDVWLRDEAGVIDEIVWDFFPNDVSDLLGPDARLLHELKARGIRVVVWRP